MCKAGLLGQVSSQKALGGCLKKILQELRIKGWQVTGKILSPESSPRADHACDSGCRLGARSEREMSNEHAHS